MRSAPKPAALRQRRNRKTTATTLRRVTVDSLVPPLPLDRIWHDETIDSWVEWWSSPMRAEWLPSDAHGVLMMAVLLDDAISSESTNEKIRCLAELRHWSEAYGLSALSRSRLHWALPEGETQREQRQPAEFDGQDPRMRLGRQQDSNVVQLPIREESA